MKVFQYLGLLAILVSAGKGNKEKKEDINLESFSTSKPGRKAATSLPGNPIDEFLRSQHGDKFERRKPVL